MLGAACIPESCSCHDGVVNIFCDGIKGLVDCLSMLH